MKYAIFKYGTGILYGKFISFTDVLPATGPSTGGTDFTLLGTALYYDIYDDVFDGLVLDAVKWVDISVGAGSVSLSGDYLHLTSGVLAGDLAGIETSGTFSDTQYEIEVNIPSTSLFPPISVSLFSFSLYGNANNHSSINIIFDADGSLTLTCDCYKGGTLIETFSTSWTFGGSVFKILRWGSRTCFYANGYLLFECKDSQILSSTFRIFVDNFVDNYQVYETKVDYFLNKPYAVFGDQIVHDLTYVSELRLRGVTPPSIDVRGIEAAYAGSVTVYLIADGTQSIVDGFEYYYDLGLTLLDDTQFGYKISDISDETVRSPETVVRGL